MGTCTQQYRDDGGDTESGVVTLIEPAFYMGQPSPPQPTGPYKYGPAQETRYGASAVDNYMQSQSQPHTDDEKDSKINLDRQPASPVDSTLGLSNGFSAGSGAIMRPHFQIVPDPAPAETTCRQ